MARKKNVQNKPAKKHPGKKKEEVWVGTRPKFLQAILQDEIHSEINLSIKNSSDRVVLAYIQMIAHVQSQA